MQDKERRRARNRNLEKYGVEVLTPDGVTPEQATPENSHSYDEQQQYSDGYFEAQHRYSSGNGMQPGAYGEYDVQNLTSYNTNGQQPGGSVCVMRELERGLGGVYRVSNLWFEDDPHLQTISAYQHITSADMINTR